MLHWLGEVYFALDRYSEAKPFYQQAMQSDEKVLGKDHPDYATNLNNLGNLYAQQGNYAEAESLHRQAIAIRKAAFGPNDARCRSSETCLSNALEGLATAAVGRAEWDAARKSRSEILQLQTELYGEHDWRVTDARLSLADVDLWAAMSPEDRQALTHCVERLRNVAETERQRPPQAKEARNSQACSAISTADRAGGYLVGRAYDAWPVRDAEPFYREALEIDKKALGEDIPTTPNLNNWLCFIKPRANMPCRPLLRRARRSASKRWAKSIATTPPASATWARYTRNGRLRPAEPLYRQASEITKKPRRKHSDYARCLNNLAYVSEETGDFNRAERLHRQASEIYKQTLGEKSPILCHQLEQPRLHV